MKEGLSLEYLYQTEKIILDHIKKIYYFTPEEISKTIFKLLEIEKNNHLEESFNTFIYFAYSGKFPLILELSIYCKFDQFTMSLACIYISLRNFSDINLLNKFELLLSQIIDKVNTLIIIRIK